jgi:hypothetical protein
VASNMAFNILVDLDSKAAAEKVDELKREMETLHDKRVKAEIDDAEFKVQAREIEAQLDVLGSKHPNINVRIDAERAKLELREVERQARELDGKTVNIHVDDNGTAANTASNMHMLLAAGVALGPAIVPVAAAVAAALAAIGTGAVAGLAGIGVLALGFSGISDGVKELGNAHLATAGKAEQAASQQISSANSIANAQDSLRSAMASVGVAQASAALAVHQAIEQEVAAHQTLEAAIRHEHDAELSLVDAQHAATRAQQDLTQARVDAQRSLQDMAFSVQDNALAQHRAQIDLKAAQAGLANVAATDPRFETAQLSVQEQQQRLTELQVQGQRLAADKADADAKGVEGSKQVTSAQDALVQANRAVVTSQQAVVDASRAIITAQQQEADATAAVTKARTDGARAVDAANQSVIQAQRSLESAQASATASMASQAAQAGNLTKAMDLLSPAGQQFAHFLNDDLRPKLQALQATAQAGLLPGVEQGLRNMLPLLPVIDGLVGDVAHTFGDMAARAGAALNSPFWRGFFDYIRAEASPSIQTFGILFGNLATAAAAIIEAFKPVWDQMSAGIRDWSARFAEASKGLSNNPEFQKFLAFVKENGPLVMHTLGDLVVQFIKLGQALAPLGVIILAAVDGLARFLNALPPEVLQAMAVGIWLLITAFNVGRTAIIAIEVATKVWTATQWLLNFALSANPIGLVILAIGALIATVILVTRNFDFFKNIVLTCWDAIKSASQFTWYNILKPIFDAFVFAINLVGQAFGGVVNWVRDNWGAIRDLAKAPIQFVVDVVYNNGILPLWNGIASVFGLHQLGPVHMATGGVLPGYAPGRDSVPAMLSPGEGVLVPEAVAALGPDFVLRANKTFSGGRVSGGPGYADGGIVGDVAGLFTDPLGTLRHIFGGVFDSASRIPGTGTLTEAFKKLPETVVNAAVDKAKDWIKSVATMGGSVGGGVAQWGGMVNQALSIMHQPLDFAGITLRRMNQESGGNPTIVNRTDSNWTAGTPSVGLMQVIGPTYRANKVIDVGPYLYGVSVDPLANTLASMHYALGRYGSLPAAYNRAGGYANGGIVTSPTLTTVGEAGPEAILPLNRPHRAGRIAAQAGLGGATVNVGPVHVHSEVDVDVLAQRLAFASSAAGL